MMERVVVGRERVVVDNKEVCEVVASQKQVKDYDRLGPGLHRLENVLQLAGGASDTGDQQAGLVDGFLDIFMKNARPLQSDERLEELLAVMKHVKWDAVMINESWREEAEEFDTLECKHVWFGSGGTRGKHGVGILLHSRWAPYVHGWRAPYSENRCLGIGCTELEAYADSGLYATLWEVRCMR
jgi:hypothetical protein